MVDIDGREIELVVDIDKMSIPDLIMFEDMRKGRAETDLRAVYEVLNRVVVGGVDKCRATDIWDVTVAVIEAIGKKRNPKAEAQVSV
jgi:hypothetical protein